MLSVIFRRSTFAAQKVWHWAGPPKGCWTSALSRASAGGSSSLQTCWASTTRMPFSERDNGRVKPPAVLGCRRIELFQRTQTHAAPCLVKNQHFHSSAVRLKKRPQLEAPRELDLLRYDMKALWQSPKPALYLGFAGLLPFVAPTLLMAVTECYFPEVAFAQLAYGASIVSFLGGARWGFTLPESSPAKPDWINLANSVVPPLLAWVSMLMSDNIVSATAMVIIALGISLHYDLALLPTYPNWFKALRAILTIVASFSLLGTLIINGTYPEKKLFSD
ncbi:transmembrane protein 69-like isoform X2 [Cottoperca gobio]|nr:transmembrane protein 69-like isoform X2 [Cottoperca gobio]XP_029285376.1 transmembrane protein 69-like isoform X2 [Cottoperca gobio]XP_029285377.1 transmembrane protein 69-like isoform X2 [Cottoperca gobio]XP_029285378.1 transmembrane protein 69-like isoform X2 [Cottoperca gobio]XP_029285379.1 transmembrane protein 69-like isoform X2 [Cottoperca gobio]